MKYKFIKEDYKKYRLDLNVWESRMLILGFIPFYVYSIRIEDKLFKITKLFKEKNPVYFGGVENFDPCYTRKELEEEYGSIWAAPINKKIKD